MIRFSKIYLYIIATMLIAWLLPWAYHFITTQKVNKPFTMFSPITKHFASMTSQDGKMKYLDLDGTEYTEAEFDSIMPTFYYRQLLSDGRLPSQINGRGVTAQLIGRENFFFRHSPSDINKTSVRLFPLLESSSGRVDLSMPEDVFRIGENIEFIKMKSNEIDVSKSEKYTSALIASGFVFPAKDVFGNPTTKKEYDEGYFIIDATGAVFHLKQVKNEPFIRNTGIDPAIDVEQIFVTEYAARHFFGFISTKKGEMYVMNTPDYSLSRLPLGYFNPHTEDLFIIGNMFFWTVKISSEAGDVFYAVNADDYSLTDEFNYKNPENKPQTASKYIFPFEISFTSYTDQWVYPRIDCISWQAILLNAVLSAIFALMHRRDLAKRGVLVKTFCLIIFGVFLFIPLLLLSKD